MTIRKTLKIELNDELGTFEKQINHRKITIKWLKDRILKYDWKYQHNILNHKDFLVISFSRGNDAKIIDGFDLGNFIKELKNLCNDQESPFLKKTNQNIWL